MGNKYDFLQASLNETIYHIPDGVKLRITSNKINHDEGRKTEVENLILYQSAYGGDLNEEFRQTLNKIISVIPNHKQNSENININELTEPNFQSIHKIFSFKNLICFGVPPSQIGIHIDYEYYQTINISGSFILFSEAVEKLDKAKKIRLWNSLQKMYGLK